ncbi:MAG: hypothetical protein ACXQTI_04000 [Candidatus Nezhaarchaeales archaeon]
MENQLLNILMQYGLAGLAVYLMYKLMCNHIKTMTSTICKKMDEMREEIRLLREKIEKLLER